MPSWQVFSFFSNFTAWLFDPRELKVSARIKGVRYNFEWHYPHLKTTKSISCQISKIPNWLRESIINKKPFLPVLRRSRNPDLSGIPCFPDLLIPQSYSASCLLLSQFSILHSIPFTHFNNLRQSSLPLGGVNPCPNFFPLLTKSLCSLSPSVALPILTIRV